MDRLESSAPWSVDSCPSRFHREPLMAGAPVALGMKTRAEAPA
jgi:hypothetical protein